MAWCLVITGTTLILPYQRLAVKVYCLAVIDLSSCQETIIIVDNNSLPKGAAGLSCVTTFKNK